jgi:LysR family transcriptional regulator, low CO2-responsive transcriptional regulator
MNIPDLHKIHIFWTVARLGSFTRAAEHLHLAQPTVSQQVAALELELGAALLERHTRGLRLTDAGQTLYAYAEKLLALANESVEAVRVTAGVAGQTLKLGVGNMLATYLLPGMLSRYRAAHPADRVRLNVGNTAELLAALAAGEIDLALVGSPADHPDVISEPFLRDRLFVIVGAGDAWAARASAALDELRERVLLTREPGSALYGTVARLLGEEALNSENVILLGETEAIKRSVELGLGVALIQGIAIQREVAAGTLRALALHGGDDSRTYLIAQRKRSTLNAAAGRFVKLLQVHVSQQPTSYS